MDVPPLAIVPFLALLTAIAVLPLAAPRLWHRNRNRAAVALLLSVPTVVFLGTRGAAGMSALAHALRDYAEFVLLLGSLYTVAGGIAIEGRWRATPATNACFLALGALLANVLGTTGASMLLARPVLRTNRRRPRHQHVPVFFIFIVGNVGGLLTPLGDPPLFLGFLRGVAFTFPLTLWPHWLLVNGTAIALFFAYDRICANREPPAESQAVAGPWLVVRGQVNGVLLLGIVAAVLLRAPEVAGILPAAAAIIGPSAAMLASAGLSLALTPAGVRSANRFSWGPMIEVAILFLGLFITMVPALALLEQRGGELGLSEPWQFFWATGALSTFLDNAPTYLAFATIAGHGRPLGVLVAEDPRILQAISAGAVFLGAMTYIGNGPNFMVKAMAEDLGYRMPSFPTYFACAVAVLLPIFAVVALIFFG